MKVLRNKHITHFISHSSTLQLQQLHSHFFHSMDPLPIINDTSFSNTAPPNTPPFHFPQISHFPATWVSGIITHRGLGLQTSPFQHVFQESAKVVSTSNAGALSAMSDGGDGKRVKTTGSNINESGKGETETSSGKPAEQEQTTPEPPPKQDYIHVRARRGQATDSHSLAERARREKISERMKILQDLVPGCNKVIGKALVLDEIINYIQSLQRQVEFLSTKLEAVNSRMTPGIEIFPPKDFDQQTFDTAGMPFSSQATRDYIRGSSPEWLHMQVGGFERTK